MGAGSAACASEPGVGGDTFYLIYLYVLNMFHNIALSFNLKKMFSDKRKYIVHVYLIFIKCFVIDILLPV